MIFYDNRPKITDDSHNIMICPKCNKYVFVSCDFIQYIKGVTGCEQVKDVYHKECGRDQKINEILK